MGKSIPSEQENVDFVRRKLEISEASHLRKVQVRAVKPYSLMLAPVYVFLKRNAKFVSVKAPLDFFTPEELDKLSSYESFFMPRFVDSTYPFHDAGKRARAVLASPPAKLPPMWKGLKPVPMSPTPYELSDAILQILGPLWAEGALIEPFFVVAFVNGLFASFPTTLLREARERDVFKCDHAVQASSWVCFLAMHLAILDLKYLERLRDSVFEHVALDRPLPDGLSHEVLELVSVAQAALDWPNARSVHGNFFATRHERIAHKIHSRLTRVKEEMIADGSVAPTIYGEEGFAGD